MLGKWGGAFLAGWAGLLLVGPASASVEYDFTSNYGSFSFISSPSFFQGGNIPGLGGKVLSISSNLEGAYFRSSDILLITPACRSHPDMCFDATFLENGIFLETGFFVASDGGAKIKIFDTSTPPPVPEPSTWALLAIGLAGLGFVGNRGRRARASG